MSDLEAIRAMLDRAKIEYDFGSTPENSTKYYHLDVERGYQGFVVAFAFDIAGTLTDLGAYE